MPWCLLQIDIIQRLPPSRWRGRLLGRGLREPLSELAALPRSMAGSTPPRWISRRTTSWRSQPQSKRGGRVAALYRPLAHARLSMHKPVAKAHLIGIAGSLRKASHSSAVLSSLRDHVAAMATLEIRDLR